MENEGKRLIVKENGTGPLCELLSDSNESVKLNVIKVSVSVPQLTQWQTITMTAEDYRGRSAFQDVKNKLKDIASTAQNQQVSAAARRAVDVISWRP